MGVRQFRDWMILEQVRAEERGDKKAVASRLIAEIEEKQKQGAG